MATHEEALTAKKALNGEAFNGRVLTVKWCAVGCGPVSMHCLLQKPAFLVRHFVLVLNNIQGVLGSQVRGLAQAEYQKLLPSAESLLWLPAGRSSSACSGLAT